MSTGLAGWLSPATALFTLLAEAGWERPRPNALGRLVLADVVTSALGRGVIGLIDRQEGTIAAAKALVSRCYEITYIR